MNMMVVFTGIHKQYKMIGKVLLRLERIMLVSDTGRHPDMRQYYQEVERNLVDALIAYVNYIHKVV
jgi:hypothetical protein